MAAPSPPKFDVDKLTCDIFSILENKFLFNYDDSPKIHKTPLKSGNKGKVRILSIDGGGDAILAGKSLAHLESYLRSKSGNPNTRISDHFDVVAGSGSGGVLAAVLFTPGKFTAEESLNLLLKTHRKKTSGIFRRRKEYSGKSDLRKVFGECTLKDTLKSVLIPCYDLSSQAPFLFSRADALEMDGYDFKIKDVCDATSADPAVAGGAVEMMSVDRRTRILAVNGAAAAMNNPTAAAITHVLNNKHEFPFCSGVEDLLVVSLGNGESCLGDGGRRYSSSTADFVRIATEGTSDMVDQSISLAFGECRTTNYVRIQANNNSARKVEKKNKDSVVREKVKAAEVILQQKNVESVLFQGKRLVQHSNVEKLEMFAGELIKEQERRKNSILPTVMLKQAMPTPRTSSATTLSSISS